MVLYAVAATIVLSLAGWIAYAIVAFFVLGPVAADLIGISERTADIIFGVVLLPVPVLLSVWVFRRVLTVERHRAALPPAGETPDGAAPETESGDDAVPDGAR